MSRRCCSVSAEPVISVAVGCIRYWSLRTWWLEMLGLGSAEELRNKAEPDPSSGDSSSKEHWQFQIVPYP